MPSNSTKTYIRKFRGLSNKKDPLSNTFENFKEARNYLIDDEGALHVRQGTTEITDCDFFYVTRFKKRAFLIYNSDLYEFDPISEVTTLAKAGIGAAPYLMADADASQIFIQSATNSYWIRGHNLFDWGIPPPTGMTVATTTGNLPAGKYRVGIAIYRNGETSGCIDVQEIILTSQGGIDISGLDAFSDSIKILISKTNGSHLYHYIVTDLSGYTIGTLNSDELARPFQYVACYPPPLGSHIAYHDARMWVAVYDEDQHYSEVYGSIPNALGLFKLDDAGDIGTYGKINLLATSKVGLVVGTEEFIAAYSSSGARRILTPYPAVDGAAFDYDRNEDLYITTVMGIRKVTGEGASDPNEGEYITNFGNRCGCGYLEERGVKQFVSTVLESGTVFGKPYTPITPVIFDHT